MSAKTTWRHDLNEILKFQRLQQKDKIKWNKR